MNQKPQKYDSYYPVKYDYVDQLPTGWQLLPNIAIFEERIEKGHPDEELLSVTIGRGVIKQTELDKKDSSTLDKSKYLLVYPNDLVYSMRFRQGASGYSNYRGIVSPACTVLKPRKYVKLNPRYYYYLFRTEFYKNYVERFSYGIADGQIPLRYTDFKRMYSIFPPVEIQNAIVTYLDENISEINRLIANKQKLIELLREERLTMMNQALTRGIRPAKQFRYSGIEWLGSVPSSWGINKLKYISNIKYGLGQPPREQNDGLPLIRATNVERGKIVENELVFVDPKDVPYSRDPILKENDIIVVRSGAYTADSAIIPKKYEGAVAGYDMVVRVTKANPKFVAYCLLSNYVLSNQLVLLRERAAQPHLNKEELGAVFILLPDGEEQRQIVDFIEASSNKIEMTVKKIEIEIELLKEYQMALVAETITGKKAIQI